MELKDIKFPGMVMLAGEYGMILGGSGLTVPLNQYSTWPRLMKRATEKEKDAAEISNMSLQKIFSYLETLPPDTFHARFDKKLFTEHLYEFWYDSTIPDGYGTDSSGALAACIYKQFFQDTSPLSLQEQRKDLAMIESYYHGKSSGVDALTSFRNTPTYFKSDGTIEEVKLEVLNHLKGYRFFLLNSHVKFETRTLQDLFLMQLRDNEFETLIREEYLTMNQKFIESLLGISDVDPGLLFRIISDFQYTHFKKMIPDSMLNAWIDGQVGNEFYLKLNGSGDGFVLGLCHYTAIDSLNNRFGNDLLWIE